MSVWNLCAANNYDFSLACPTGPTPYPATILVNENIDHLVAHVLNPTAILGDDCVYVSVKLMARLGTIDGAYVQVQNPNLDICKIFRIIACTWDLHQIALSSIAAYHLGIRPLWTMHDPIKTRNVNISPTFTRTLPEAVEIQLAMVYEPGLDKSHVVDACTNAIERWVCQGHIVHLHDILSIRVACDSIQLARLARHCKISLGDVHIDDSDSDSISVLFKITQIRPEHPSALCTSRNTRITQHAIISSRIPIPSSAPCTSGSLEIENLMNAMLHSNLPGMCILIHGRSGTGKTTSIRRAAIAIGAPIYLVDCVKIAPEDAIASLKREMERVSDRLQAHGFILLSHLDQLCQKLQRNPAAGMALADLFTMSKSPLIATCDQVSSLLPDVRTAFTFTLHMKVPDHANRCTILQDLARVHGVNFNCSIDHIAKNTAALTPRDLNQLILEAKSNVSLEQHDDTPIHVQSKHMDVALDKIHSRQSDNLGAPKIPSVIWEDVGGLAHVKQEIMSTVILPLHHPEFFENGLQRRSGLLLYGPPGTGKTLVAKAVATECRLNFISVKGPELINMYIGESEANIRRIFQKALDAAPSIIFFDELDSIAPKRGEKGDAGGVMDRIVSQLLVELDSLACAKTVFVMGATNRPDLLDEALLRPGRFDKLVYLDAPKNNEAQIHVLRALARKLPLDADLDLAVVAKHMPFTLTGADIYALTADAMLKAMTRVISSMQMDAGTQPDVKITLDDFIDALKTLQPSVTLSELEHYRSLEKKYSSTNRDKITANDGEQDALGVVGIQVETTHSSSKPSRDRKKRHAGKS